MAGARLRGSLPDLVSGAHDTGCAGYRRSHETLNGHNRSISQLRAGSPAFSHGPERRWWVRRETSSARRPTLSWMTVDEQQSLLPMSGEEELRLTIEQARAAQRQTPRARRVGAVSDEEIRCAVAKAEGAAIRRALETAKRAQQRGLFLTLGR